jgi:hypothetical protein
LEIKMPINNIYSLKDCSVSSVGAGHSEFTPLERGKSLDEGGSPQVGGGHDEVVPRGLSVESLHKSGRRSWERPFRGGRKDKKLASGGGHASMEGKPEKLSRLWEGVRRRHLGVCKLEKYISRRNGNGPK